MCSFPVWILQPVGVRMGAAGPSWGLRSTLGFFEGGQRPKVLCMSPLGWVMQEKGQNMSGEGPAPVGSAAPVTPPEWVLSLPWLCVQGKQSTSWLCLQTHISIAAGAMGSMQSFWTSGDEPCPCRAQSIPHSPPGLEKSSSVTPVTAPMGSGSGVCLDKMCWGTNWTKGQWQMGQGTCQAAWGQLVPLRNPPGLGASPPCSQQMHRHGCRAA